MLVEIINVQTAEPQESMQDSVAISEDKIVNQPEEIVIRKTMDNLDHEIRKVM